MILLDKPFVSDLLRETILGKKLPVVLTKAALELGFANAPGAISQVQAVEQMRNAPDSRVLTNSENAIGWIARNLDFTTLPATIELFKNKVKFRQLLENLYPDFRYREILPDQLDDLNPEEMGGAFVIKPTVGFFSLGVHVVKGPQDWPEVKRTIGGQWQSSKHVYPPEVLDATSFIIEEMVDGTEFAVDAYYDGHGFPVITNILQHLFSSESDVSDRVYLTGEQIVQDHLESFTSFLDQVGQLAGLRNFPVHVEVRVDAQGNITPIEFNPLRFGGWCTTADLTALGYGFNPYLAFLNDERPDWEKIFSTRKGKLFSIVVLDNSTGLDPAAISKFDHNRMAAGFRKPLELRPLDHHKHGFFGFLFAETPLDEMAELERILHSNLREFVVG